MKKTCRTNSILIFLGRPLTLLFLIVPMFAVFFQVKNFEFKPISIFCLLVSLSMLSLGFLCVKYLWRNCWGKLIVKGEYVFLKCIFCKTRRLHFKDIKIARVCKFQKGNAVKNINFYNTGNEYILLSSDNKILESRIDKIKCDRETIKFLLSPKAGKMLNSTLPTPLNNAFSKWK